MEKEWLFTKKDMTRIFLRKKKLYVSFFIWASCLTIFFRLIQPPSHIAQATFRFSNQGGEQSDLLRSVLQNSRVSAGKENGVQSVLESRTLLRQVVEELGLNLEGPRPFFLIRWVQSAKDRIFSELGWKIPDRRDFIFSKAHFKEDVPSDFFLSFTEQEAFDVYGLNKKKLGSGKIDIPVTINGNTFTLQQTKSAKPGHTYKIHVEPWASAVKNVRGGLKIKPNKMEKTIFSLTFSHPSSEIACYFLNHLMSFYREHLKKENEEMASTQMQYLEKRQSELMKKYDKSLEEHQAFIHQGLDETGFVHLKQEIHFLERPSEDYLARLHEIDLKLNRLKQSNPLLKTGNPQMVSFEKKKPLGWQRHPELEGVTPEIVEKLCIEYNEQWDTLRTNIEQLSSLEKQVFRPEFEVTSLSGILTDAVSQEMIQKATKISLDLQDTENHSVKDKERLQASLDVQKRFLSQHIVQLLHMQKLKSRLLKEKIFSLQETSARLLGVEKDLLLHQLAGLQNKMKSLPEKWKRENQLTMQRDLSVGMLEGLAQLTESKNVHHQLFYVESKPIDLAHIPLKPNRGFILLQGGIVGFILCFFLWVRDCLRWFSLGLTVTEENARKLGVDFCGFLPLFCRDLFHNLKKEHTQALRKAAAFIFSQKEKNKRTCIAVLSAAPSFCSNVASLLHLQGSKVLVVECSPSVFHQEKEVGLYDYLAGLGPVTILQDKDFDRLPSGRYEKHFVEFLFRENFDKLIKGFLDSYDVVILSLEAPLSDPAVLPLKAKADALIVHAEDVLYEQMDTEKKWAVVLSH